MKDLFIHYSYYLMWGVCLVWVWVCSRTVLANEERIISKLQSARWSLLFIFIFTFAAFLNAHPSLRVLADQTNLLAVAKSMTFEKTVRMPTEGTWGFENFRVLTWEIPTRPLLYPFLIHLVHGLSGYRIENAYAVNFICLLAYLVFFYFLTERWLGKKWGLAAVVLIASQPLVTQTSASAAMEFTNAVFFFAAMGSVAWYLKKPSAETLLFLWANLLMLGHTRYESALLAFATLVFLAAARLIAWADVRRHAPIYVFTPILCLPLFWQRLLTQGEYNCPADRALTPFTLANLREHAAAFFGETLRLGHLLPYDGMLPYANVVNLAGLAALLFFLIRFLISKKRPTKSDLWFGLIFGLNLGLFYIIIASYYLGMPDQPTFARYYVILVTVLTMSALWFMNHVRVFRKKPLLVLAFTAVCFFTYHSSSMENRFSNRQYLVREYNFAMSFLKKETDKNFLLIHDRPGLFVVSDYGAITFTLANRNREGTLLDFKRHFYRDIFVLQRIEYKTGQPEKDCVLDGTYKLETLTELQNGADFFFRLSKVIPPK